MDFCQRMITVKKLLLIAAFLLPAVSFSQSLSGGVSAGFIPPVFGEMLPFGGVNLEYSFRNSDLSLNTGLDLFTVKKETFLSFPVYIKASTIGKFRFCPFVGGFAHSNGRLGWLIGAGLEYGGKDRINLFLQTEMYGGYYKGKPIDKMGNQDEYWSKYVIPQVRIGIKKNILRSGGD